MTRFDSYEKIDWKLIADKIKKAKVVKKEGKHNSKYLDISVAFDTETTSTYINEPREKFAFMYVWQFGIDGYYCYGRTWTQFLKLLMFMQEAGNLGEKKRLLIYIHNLSFEFQFFRKYIPWGDIFATDEHEPIKAVSQFGIEFRDSLILSGYKLDNVAKNLTKHKIPKMVGDLDYTKVRNSKTTFTEKELGYMLNDVRVLVAYIDEQREMYRNIAFIPLTNTGRVRQFVREKCFGKHDEKRGKYHMIMNRLTLDKSDYHLMREGFAGGFTHANPTHVGKTYHNVASIDFTSSYPTVMIAEKYPNSVPFKKKFTNMKDFEQLCRDKLVLFTVKFTNLVSTVDFDNYISKSKCLDIQGFTENNGRVFSADSLTLTITNVDWGIIKQVYYWDKVEITNINWFYKQYLPKPIIESIIDLYQNKTKLKGIEDKKAEYMHSKGMLNSVYGASVQKVLRPEIVYDDGAKKWETQPADADKELTQYNKSYNRVLYYGYGIFVAAYARANLWNGILNIRNDYIYSDTDSIKMLNWDKHKTYVEQYNKKILDKLHKALEFYHLPVNSIEPKTVDGVTKPLGVWDNDGFYKSFKTLGAKRYVYSYFDKKDHNKFKLETTIAGLGKEQGEAYLLSLSDNDPDQAVKNFKNNFTVPAGKTGKLTHTYIEDMKQAYITDFQGHTELVTALSGEHLEPAGYTLSMSKDYQEFLQGLGKGYIIFDKTTAAKGI